MTEEYRQEQPDAAEKRAAARRRFKRRAKKLPGFLKEMFLLRFMRREDYKEYSRVQFDQAAAAYDLQGSYEMVKKDYPGILGELKKEPFDSLLDCGCGTGAMLALLQRDCPEKTYMGIDLSEGMLEIAKSRELEGVSLVSGDCEELPFSDGEFDVVLCSHSFHHYPHPKRFFRNAYRVLKPGGRLIVYDNTGSFTWLLKQNLLVIPLNNWKKREGDVRFYSLRQVRRFCRRAGFTGVQTEERSGHKLFCMARKSCGS